MNENQAINAINAAAGKFCGVYKDFGSALDTMGNEITQLEERAQEIGRKYNIDISKPITDFFNDDNITEETYYNALSESEKFKNDKGETLPFDLLTDGERESLRVQVKTMNAEQGKKKLEIVNMKAAIDNKSMQFERLIVQYREQIRISNESFLIRKREVERQIKDLENEALRLDDDKKLIALDSSITNKSALIKDVNKKIALCEVNQAILKCVTKAADVYTVVFSGIFDYMKPDMYENDETIKYDDLYRNEMSIANSIQDLVDGFRTIKDNYSAELDKLNAVELLISQFKDQYENFANANEFIRKANEATKSVRATIKKIEETKEIDKAKTDDKGNVIVEPTPAPGEPGEPAPGEPGEPAPGEPGEPAPGEPGEPAPGEPGEPAPGEPGEPAPGEPGEPAPAEPGEPAPAEPGEPAPGEPGEPAPGEPLAPQNGVDENIANIMKSAKRVRSARRMKTMKRSLAAVTLGVAAAGLGFLPPLAPVSAALFTGASVLGAAGVGYALVNEAWYDLPAYAKYKATSFKLNRIAHNVTKQFNKHNKKSGIKFKVVSKPETGEIRFGIIQDGKEVGLIDSRSTGIVIDDDHSLNEDEVGNIVQLFQEQLDKKFAKFNNPDKRGTYQDKYNIPPINVDNLAVLYTEFGGYNFNLEGDQFGMMDEMKTHKAHKERKGIKSLFRRKKRRRKDIAEEDDLPDLNNTQHDALDDLVTKNSPTRDNSSEGSPVGDDDLEDLLTDLDDNPSNTQTGDNTPVPGEPVPAEPAPAEPVVDPLNDPATADLYNAFQNQFGLDDVDMTQLQTDLASLTQEQSTDFYARISDVADKNELFKLIEDVKNPSVNHGMGL